MSARALAGAFALAFLANAAAQDAFSVDPQSGLVIDDHWELVRANCSGCHSTRLVIQNRMSTAGWVHAIRWMQAKHNLWDLGESEVKIVAYLEKHYGVTEGVGDRPLRRRPLNQPPLPEKEQSQ